MLPIVPYPEFPSGCTTGWWGAAAAGLMVATFLVQWKGRQHSLATWPLSCALSYCNVKLLQCPSLCDPTDCSPPGSSMLGILQARIPEWVVMPFSRGSSWPMDQIQVSRIADRFFTNWATRGAYWNIRTTSFWLKNETRRIILIFPECLFC